MTDTATDVLHEGETRAIVIGAGIAGLVSARALSDYYTNVLIIERDILPSKPDPRAGTPQAHHLHRLLPSGKMVLERLFPGYIDSLIAEGAYPVQGAKTLFSNNSGSISVEIQDKDVMCSRGLLEWEIRRRVQILPNVRFLTEHEVVDLDMQSGPMRVTGVRVRKRGQQEEEKTIEADLVLDASGRTTQLPQWLSKSGYTIPESETVHSSIGYSTRYYEMPADFAEKRESLFLVEGYPPKNTYGAAAAPIEKHMLTVILGSLGAQHYPPTHVDEFEQELTQVITSQLADMLRDAKPLTTPRGFRIPECVRHHYEQIEHWPAGLLVLGDALCHFDPIYGQGMTVSVMEAAELGTCLGEQRQEPQPDFEQRVLHKMQDIIYPAWWLSSIADLSWPGVKYSGQEPPKGQKLLQSYMDVYKRYMVEHYRPLEPGEEPDLRSPEPDIFKFFLMNGLMVPPKVVFNEVTFALLLESEAAIDGPHPLDELTQAYNLPLKEIIDEVLPNFALSFVPPQPAPAA